MRGTRGEATDTYGCTVYDVSNKERLGSSTVEQIQEMVKGVQLLMEQGGAKEEEKVEEGTSDKNAVPSVKMVTYEEEPDRVVCNGDWSYEN